MGIRQLAEFANPKSHNATKIEILLVCRKAVLQKVTVKLYYIVAYYSMIKPHVIKTILFILFEGSVIKLIHFRGFRYLLPL